MVSTTAHTLGMRAALSTNQMITASMPTWSPETEKRCIVPVKRKSSVNPSGEFSVTPSVIPFMALRTSTESPMSTARIASIR